MRKSEQMCDCKQVHTEILEKVKNETLDTQFLTKMTEFYKAFSDSTRIKIINALGIHEMCVCDIAVLLDMTKSAVSHQLKYLKNLNIIKSRRDGKLIFYALADDHVKELFDVCLEHIKEEHYE